jgi:hypothetical protein
MTSSDPLLSWNEGSAKQNILDFVRTVTTAGGPHYVKPEERIAVFDNDGTLWCEQPSYFQFMFVLDRMKAMAPQHPEWKDNPLYAGVLAGDMKAVAAEGVKGVLELATVTHSGMTTDEFAKIVEDWISSARHPKFNRPYTDVIFQPMLELLAYLRSEHNHDSNAVSGLHPRAVSRGRTRKTCWQRCCTKAHGT